MSENHVAADPPCCNHRVVANPPKADRAAHLKTWAKSLRLSGYDYTNAGFYFVTISCKDRISYFKDVRIARTTWTELAGYFNKLIVAAVIMPDHIHLIIELAGVDCSLGKAVMDIKRALWLKLRKHRLSNNSIFQRNYYEHVIRNDIDLREKIEYMMANPIRKGLAESFSEWKWAWHKWVE